MSYLKFKHEHDTKITLCHRVRTIVLLLCHMLTLTQIVCIYSYDIIVLHKNLLGIVYSN